ncbi:ryncolin-4-like [Ostrea edulis]|uniref:ryncolin-4-like n=1 Tax=Ostrea edulis TaxID=37623 RepID=UPI002096239B|nr:ryncolin-4-like [Ostrea edulis]
MYCLEISFVTGVLLLYLAGIDAIKSSPVRKRDPSTQYESCKDILDNVPSVKENDGVYEIYVGGQNRNVFCDMSTDGGGWTVIQKRMDGSTDFYRKWDAYKIGFGNPCSNYWIGNDAIHTLTTTKDQMLRIELQSFDCDQTYATYATFRVGDESSDYKLTISGYKGDAGDTLSFQNGRKFSTQDRSDVNMIHPCVQIYHGAWWYDIDNCTYSNLNGKYGNSNGVKSRKSMKWKNLLKGTSMMVRPKN